MERPVRLDVSKGNVCWLLVSNGEKPLRIKHQLGTVSHMNWHGSGGSHKDGPHGVSNAAEQWPFTQPWRCYGVYEATGVCGGCVACCGEQTKQRHAVLLTGQTREPHCFCYFVVLHFYLHVFTFVLRRAASHTSSELPWIYPTPRSRRQCCDALQTTTLRVTPCGAAFGGAL